MTTYKHPKRFTIRPIADEYLEAVEEDVILAEYDDYDDAKAGAGRLSGGYHYGVAIVDERQQLLDVGFGLGVKCPELPE
jgi:hypothetical protein